MTKNKKKTSVRRRENRGENMRMSEFVTMRDEVHVVAVKSTRLKADSHYRRYRLGIMSSGGAVQMVKVSTPEYGGGLRNGTYSVGRRQAVVSERGQVTSHLGQQREGRVSREATGRTNEEGGRG